MFFSSQHVISFLRLWVWPEYANFLICFFCEIILCLYCMSGKCWWDLCLLRAIKLIFIAGQIGLFERRRRHKRWRITRRRRSVLFNHNHIVGYMLTRTPLNLILESYLVIVGIVWITLNYSFIQLFTMCLHSSKIEFTWEVGETLRNTFLDLVSTRSQFAHLI